MTCNNCLQEILQGESFFEDEDNGTAYHADCRQAAVDRRNRAEDERAAALARVEAAEAERDDANIEAALNQANAAEAWGRVEEAEAEAARLSARVAELEAAQAAQQWRPVTDEPDADGMYPVRVRYRGQVHLDREMRNWNRVWGWNDMFQSVVVEWYPLPPAPQEPTP